MQWRHKTWEAGFGCGETNEKRGVGQREHGDGRGSMRRKESKTGGADKGSRGKKGKNAMQADSHQTRHAKKRARQAGKPHAGGRNGPESLALAVP